MAVHAAGLEHRVYVLVAITTHVLVGFTLARVWTRSDSVAGVAGALLPDVDLLFAPGWQFPLVHRGITHTPSFGAVVVGALLLRGRRRVALGVALGFLSHLLLDSLTRSGVMWLYPASTARYAFDVSVHGAAQTVGLWALLLLVWMLRRGPPQTE